MLVKGTLNVDPVQDDFIMGDQGLYTPYLYKNCW